MSTVLPVVKHDGMQLGSSRIIWRCCASFHVGWWDVWASILEPGKAQGISSLSFSWICCWCLPWWFFVLAGLERRSIPSVSIQLRCGFLVFPVCCSRIYMFLVDLGFLLLPGYCGFAMGIYFSRLCLEHSIHLVLFCFGRVPLKSVRCGCQPLLCIFNWWFQTSFPVIA